VTHIDPNVLQAAGATMTQEQFQPLLQCVDEKGNEIFVRYLGFKLEGDRKVFTLEVEASGLDESIEAPAAYDLLVHLARMVVRWEGPGDLPSSTPSSRSDPLTEEALDAAVKVVLQHKLVNIVNSILKQSSLQDLISERVRPLWQKVDGR
jgi:hypothetical protein